MPLEYQGRDAVARFCASIMRRGREETILARVEKITVDVLLKPCVEMSSSSTDRRTHCPSLRCPC